VFWAQKLSGLSRDHKEDNFRSGRLNTTSSPDVVDKVWNLLARDRRMTLRRLEVEVNVNALSVKYKITTAEGNR
jgi:hypothetical protein